ncbi:MAG: hypothetical protein IGS50_07585 [Synechococcales cyanobacterium C42_A2020_086]|jgi:hypothetical protein|nr:hypothetical protein [Synechococcales cyanobacterium M58_A2018_015]MBF2073607.1 hypothetical protein [Synechococcales cyanobacterium C42_A2020_086]
MNSPLNVILKVMLASLALAVAIKYGGPMLPIPASAPVALTLVLLPTLLMGIALVWRAWQANEPS